MTTLHCLACGRRVADVHDLRFGLAPSESLCVACSRPAFFRVTIH